MDYLQPKFYRFSEDSVWLAKKAAKLCDSEPSTLLDIGCGCGVVGIETANRLPSVKKLVLLEPQAEFEYYLKKNQSLLREGVNVELARSALEDWKSEAFFDLVVSNPPYFREGAGRAAADIKRSKCRTFASLDHSEFCLLAQGRLGPRGTAYILGHESNADTYMNGGELVERKGKVALFQFSKSFT